MVQEFCFNAVHQAGKDHIDADILSRMPLPTTFDHTGTLLDPHPNAHRSAVEHLQQHFDSMHMADPPKKRAKRSASAPFNSNIAPIRARPATDTTASGPASSPAASTRHAAAPSSQHLPVNPAAFLAQTLTSLPVSLSSHEDALALPLVANFIDLFAPAKRVAPGQGYQHDGWWDPNTLIDDKVTAPASDWAKQATNAVCHAAADFISAKSTPFQPLSLGPRMPSSVCQETLAICNRPVGPSFYKS